MSADNQQERPSGIPSHYISGFVDGEGCFSVTIQRSNNVKLGVQVIPEFHVCQHQRRSEVLEAIREVLGCGYIKPNNPRNPKDLTSVLVVRNISDVRDKVIPFFTRNPLYSSKQQDFEKFKVIVAAMDKGEHLVKDGLAKILSIAFSMNDNGKYRKLKLKDVMIRLESSETVCQAPRKR